RGGVGVEVRGGRGGGGGGRVEGPRAGLAAEAFGIPQRGETARPAAIDEPPDSPKRLVFAQAERGAGVAERPGRQRKGPLQGVDDRAVGRIDGGHQWIPCARAEKTAPRCLKQRVENNTAWALSPVRAARLS